MNRLQPDGSFRRYSCREVWPIRKAPRARHPVVIRHPISGQKVLYVNPGFTEGIEGWHTAESDYLYEHAAQPQFSYRHRWRTGDVAFWDNRATLHCALDDCFGHRRIAHRITVEGEQLHRASIARLS